VARTTDWYTTEYNNLNSPSTFTTGSHTVNYVSGFLPFL